MPARRRSSRNKSGGKKDNEDAAYSPGRGDLNDKMGRPSGYGLRQRRFEDGVELMMECEEEDLLPAQIEAFKRDMEEFEAAKRKIKAAKDEQLRLQQEQAKQQQQQQHHQQQQLLRQQQQSVMAAQLKTVAPTSAPQPDVIIVGESPPKQLPTTQPAQPAASSAARMVNPTPQQVYKFVNLPGQTNTAANNQWVIRPLMQVMPQQNAANQIQPRMNQTVSIQKSPYVAKQTGFVPQFQQIQVANSLLGNKRPIQYNMAQQQQYVSPPKKRAKRPDDDVGALVPLDEYYYGKKEGDPTYIEDKGEHRFKCWYCSKMLYNNVKTMMHMQGHIDSEKQQNLDLSDLTQCKHCYKQFDTPFEMQTHIEKVHMNNANVLLCRICEKDHDSRHSLTHHMKQNHNACEMPYICQLCHFRSSMYSDVVDHFKKKHEHSDCVLCLYCLKIFHIKFVSQGWGQTQNYYHHLLRHQSKTNAKKCQLCKLTFFNAQEVKAHRKRDHMPNQKGVIGMNAKYTTPDQVMIRVPESGLQPKTLGVKSLNAPAVSKVSEHRGLRYPRAVQRLHCFECKMIMATNDHYKKYIQCSMCRFATSCSFAYANHMMGFHSGQITSLNLNIAWERPLPHPMYCLCGFGSKYGNKIANHLVFCTKRSCYKEKIVPPPKEDKVDEEQDPRRKPGASLLDVLGLVKKPNIVSTEPVGDKSSNEGKRFESPSPRERTPSPEPSTSMQSDVPVELTGAQKWLTVKLKDDKTPTKAAVFGTEETDSRPFTPEPDDKSRDVDDIDMIVNAALAEPEDKEENKEEESNDEKDVEDKDKDADKENETDKDGEEAGDRGVANEECSVLESSNDKEDMDSSTLKDVDNTVDMDADRAKDVNIGDDSAVLSASVEDMDTDVLEGKDSASGDKEGGDVGDVDNTETGKFEPAAQTDVEGVDLDEDNMDSANVSSENSQLTESEKQIETEKVKETSESETSLHIVKDTDSYLPEDKADSEMPCEEMVQEENNSETHQAESDTGEAESETREVSETHIAESETQKVDSETHEADSEIHEAISETHKADSNKSPPHQSEGSERPVSPQAVDASTGVQEENETPSEKPEVSETPISPSGETSADKPEEREIPISGETSVDKLEESEMSVGGVTSADKPEESEMPVSQSGETSADKPEESEKLPSARETDRATSHAPEDAERPSDKTDETQSTHKPPGGGSSGDPTDKTKESSEARVSASISSASSSSASSSDKYSQDRSRDYDRDRSYDRSRDRSDERDRERSRDHDKDRSYDHERSRDRAYDRDRDRREQHRSDRDRDRHGGHGGHSGGYRDRYDDRRYQNDNRNYNRYQGGNRDYHGGYHGNQSHYQGGYRDNYGNQRDRYGHNNRGQGYHGNRDYRGRGQGYRGNY